MCRVIGALTRTPPFRVERFRVPIGAHFHDGETLGDDICSKAWWQIVDLPGPIESQRHALNRAVRLAKDSYLHSSFRQQRALGSRCAIVVRTLA